MCTLLIACSAHPRYPLVIAANRDEFYDRPTAAASSWQDAPGLFGGRDLLHGGTWLGVTETGRIAALTNYRQPHTHPPDAPTRGKLVSGFLAGEKGAERYLDELHAAGLPYCGFNLVVGEVGSLYHYSNKSGLVTPLTSGIFGISNRLLDTPWPKVERGKAGLQRVLAGEDPSAEELFAVLADGTKAPDEELPDTGVGLEWERLLSSIFIESERYGTRCSTVIMVDSDLQALFVERTFNGGGVSEVKREFDWSGRTEGKGD
ncbi:NRDE family protein [Geomonas sp. Red32]|uniref:NRDE family protein n=1 Tax=Geomonas sp. Red32 TaxID=2912856 RepID=UPI00202CABE6|nr:NRDE family protein [Geomonas sp. Red32]MCM0079985.1 NRDE family protein [Geomonas sp. Red32]